MKREAVREDRTPGGKHRNKRPRLLDDNASMQEAAQNITSLVLPHDTYDETLVHNLVEARPDLMPAIEEIFTDGKVPCDQTPIDINDLMQYGYVELRYIIEWARKVPGFSDLIIEDQMALLKASFMELNVLRLSHRSLRDTDEVRFAEHLVLKPDEGVSIGWGLDLINSTLEFVARMKCIQMDHTEFCILNAIVLTYPGECRLHVQ